MSSSESGLVIVDKSGGMTSHDVVARARRTLGTRKVGHAGTLDPMATGVLVLGVNRATRLLGHLMLTEKTYDATVRLGQSTSTDDAEGEILTTAETGDVTEAVVQGMLAQFTGDIEQVPTAVSAIKVDGKRAYQRVRDGEEVELKARPVTIGEITAGDFRHEDGFVDFSLRVRCSSGTYIRALARDIGAGLGVGGHLTALRRHSVGDFTLAGANTDLDQLVMVPIADAARRTFSSVDLDEKQATDVRVGRKLAITLTGTTAVFAPEGEFLALYEPFGAGNAKPVAVFVG